DITPLQSLTNLTKLYLSNNQISDITPLQSLTNLTHLYLYGNQISDITPLQSLTNLTDLNLYGNQISDITPLQSLTNLTSLHLSNNQISDITPLQSLTNLTSLHLSNNQISDITPLQSLTNLAYLNVNFKPEHKALIEACRQKWGTLANSTKPISNPKAAAAVKSVCEILGLKASEITFCSSPNGGVAQIPLKRSNDTDLIKRLTKRVKDALHPFFLTELRQELSELSIWEEQLEQQLNGNFLDYRKYSKSIFTPKYLVEALAVAELCVSGFGIVLKPEAQKVFECLNQLLAECGWIILLDDTCIVCSRPIKLSLDSEYRLHAEGEPALEFPDGYKIYSYYGVTLPEKYGQIHPNLWQAQWLLAEKNAELRRVLIQGIGYARICSELQATELDCWKEYTLLKIDADIDGFDPDDFEDDDDAPKKEDIYLLKMICPSTGHIHALRVPPDVRSAKEAIRWVNWDIDPEEFGVQT
ncbi:leucine-rich repeat domain-containing protein, partial [Microcoleus sp. A003_D6]|uniref:leucine-rich repeat domain-containing protein n=1 Tax=Microcoleus sp. A003_D6 TaxID=3055266 RepID=UPI002FD635E6